MPEDGQVAEHGDEGNGVARSDSDSLEAIELEIEHECVFGGIGAFRDELRRLQVPSPEENTDLVARLVREVVTPTCDNLCSWLTAGRTRRGRPSSVLDYLKEVDPQIASLICINVVLWNLRYPQSLQFITREIGTQVERARRLIRQDRSLEGDTPDGDLHLVPTGGKVAGQSGKDADLPRERRMRVGLQLIDALLSGSDVFARAKLPGRRRLTTIAVADPEADWLPGAMLAARFLMPRHLPMRCPPRPFTSERGGGYLLGALRTPLVRDGAKTGGRLRRERAKQPAFFAAVNTLQGTAWQVNSRVLDVVQRLWRLRDLPNPSVASREEDAHRVRIAANLEAQGFFADAEELPTFSGIFAVGRRMQSICTVAVAGKFQTGRIWFPMYADFRGRVYSACSGLSPQGDDLAKGLLEFADPLPLGQNGERWMSIHLANSWGYDKRSFVDRIGWVTAESSMLEACGRDPLGHREWLRAENPFVALAACIEWAGLQDFKRSGGPGSSFQSRLPVTVDGSCNGIQHLSALVRDPIAGSKVNLVPAEMPADVYREVAVRVEANLKQLVASNEDATSSDIAKNWLALGVDRSLTKKPTMILPYGGSKEAAVRGAVAEWLAKKPAADSFGPYREEAISLMADKIWDAMATVVVGPYQLMEWSQRVATAVKKTERPLHWFSPSGFEIRQAYVREKEARLKGKLRGKPMSMLVLRRLNKLNGGAQRRSLAPNWIHSLDAAALHLTVADLATKRVTSVMAIHDSFGTHAGNMDLLSCVLREQFVAMYSEDRVAEFVQHLQTAAPEAKLPPPPEQGDLDLSGVLRSEYFFA